MIIIVSTTITITIIISKKRAGQEALLDVKKKNFNTLDPISGLQKGPPPLLTSPFYPLVIVRECFPDPEQQPKEHLNPLTLGEAEYMCML